MKRLSYIHQYESDKSKIYNFQQGWKCISTNFTFHVKLKINFSVSVAGIKKKHGNKALHLRNTS